MRISGRQILIGCGILAGLCLLVLLGLAALFLRNGGVGAPTSLSDAPAPTTQPLAAYVSVDGVNLPPGFTISRFAAGLDGPRMLALGPDGAVYVAERTTGRILRLPDRDGDGRLDQIEVVAEGLTAPSSLAFYQDGSLYVGEPGQVLRLSQPDASGLFNTRAVIVAGIPTDGHNTRTVLFSPDWQYLYVSIGSSCNVCEEADPRRAAIMRYHPDGSGETLFTAGLRNAVGLTFRPGTAELWATNNGRDWLGDDLPPETVYLASLGADAGWPRCHSGRILDPEFGSPGACAGVLAPQVEIQAHSAPLGLAFYSGAQFPVEYQGDLFVALHGSWNRSTPTGYKVVRVDLEDGVPGAVTDFAWGWLRPDNERWGRPVDVLTGADGALYISDDGGGVIYRIVYTGI